MHSRPLAKAKFGWAFKTIPYDCICPTPFFFPCLTSILYIILRILVIHIIFPQSTGGGREDKGQVSGGMPLAIWATSEQSPSPTKPQRFVRNSG